MGAIATRIAFAVSIRNSRVSIFVLRRTLAAAGAAGRSTVGRGAGVGTREGASCPRFGTRTGAGFFPTGFFWIRAAFFGGRAAAFATLITLIFFAVTFLTEAFLAGFAARAAGFRVAAFRAAGRADRLTGLPRGCATRAFAAGGLRAGGFFAGLRLTGPERRDAEALV
jgi:hypothetical protein